MKKNKVDVCDKAYIYIERRENGYDVEYDMNYDKNIQFDWSNYGNKSLINIKSKESLVYNDAMIVRNLKTGELFIYPSHVVDIYQLIDEYSATNWFFEDDHRLKNNDEEVLHMLGTIKTSIDDNRAKIEELKHEVKKISVVPKKSLEQQLDDILRQVSTAQTVDQYIVNKLKLIQQIVESKTPQHYTTYNTHHYVQPQPQPHVISYEQPPLINRPSNPFAGGNSGITYTRLW